MIPVAAGDNGLKGATSSGGGCVARRRSGWTCDGGGVEWIGR